MTNSKVLKKRYNKYRSKKNRKRSKRSRGGSSIKRTNIHDIEMDISEKILADLIEEKKVLEEKLRLINSKISNLRRRSKNKETFNIPEKYSSKIEKYMRDTGEVGDVNKKFKEYRSSWNKLSKEDKNRIRSDYNRLNKDHIKSYLKEDNSFIDRESHRQYEIDVMLDWLSSVKSRAAPARPLGIPDYHKKTPLKRQNAVRNLYEQPRF